MTCMVHDVMPCFHGRAGALLRSTNKRWLQLCLAHCHRTGAVMNTCSATNLFWWIPGEHYLPECIVQTVRLWWEIIMVWGWVFLCGLGPFVRVKGNLLQHLMRSLASGNHLRMSLSYFPIVEQSLRISKKLSCENVN